MTIITRPFTEADREGVISLWLEAFADDPPWNEPGLVIDRKLKVQPELFLVAVGSDSISGPVVVGTVVAGYDGFRGWLHHVAVRQNYQGRGVARLVVQQALTMMAAMGCAKVNLQVRTDNHAVRGFYEGLGFEEEQRLSFGIQL